MRPNHKNNNNNNSVDNTDNDLRSPLQQHTVKFSNCISNQDDIFSSSSSCSSSNQNDDTIKIRIKSNIQNTKDVTITIPQSFTVHQLKDEIRSSCFTSTKNNDENNATLTHPKNDNLQHTPHDILPISKDRYLRLICSGRLLAPDSTKVSDFNSIKDGSVIHAVLSAPGIRGGQQALLSRDSSSSRRHSTNQRRFRGAGVGSNGLILPRRRRSNNILMINNNNSSDNDDDDEEDIEQGRERRGLDRLRANGMSRDEILTLRTYFSQHIDRFIQQQNQLNQSNNSNNNTISTNTATIARNNDNNNSNTTTQNNTEDPILFRLRMEEEWMNAQGPYSEFRLNTNLSNTNTTNNNNNINNAALRNRAYINGLEIDATTREITRDFRNQTGGSVIGSMGTNRDFTWGFVLGYSFGFMTMFIIWLPTVPHKQRVGILSGFCCHMMLRILERQQPPL